ncbi:MAG: hypothetical protein L0216_00345 [Planctomycetales bacterium]|nr:hypothetical protein [Planctomycetales bacterium]
MSPGRSLAVASSGAAAALAAAAAIWLLAPGARPLALLPLAAAGAGFLLFVRRLVKPARAGGEEGP